MSQWIDCPVEEEANDELGRGPFAALVAAALLAENKRRATVVGLTGGWGTGKSTVANFVINRVKDANKDIEVIRFEPWMVSTSEALAREFFKELGKAVLPKGDSKEAKDKRARFYRYTALTLDALALTTDASNTLGVPLTGLATRALRGSKKAIDLAARGLEAQSHQPTLREARETMSEALVGLERPVVVVIDDIDRLNTDEVRTVFQLIKACADFPNVRYLLLYDRDQVVHALKDSVSDSEAFLEKIVSQVFDLPLATKKQRETVLARNLEALGVHELEGKPIERLQEVFRSVLLPGLPTVRHVKRYLGTVASLLPGVIVDQYRNVDPADFLALEFLRQYVPRLYNVLREEEAPVPGGLVFEIAHSEKLAEQRKQAREAAIPAEEPMRALAAEALAILNDDIENYAGVRRAWTLKQHTERRFASEHWKPVYFGFHSGRAALKDEDWSVMRATLSQQPQEYPWLDRLSNAEDRTIFARAVADRADDLSVDEAKKLLEAIVVWGEKQVSEPYDSFANLMDPMSAVWLIGTSCLVRITKAEDTVRVVLDVLNITNAVGCIGYISGMEHEQIKKLHGHGDWTTAERFIDLSDKLTPMLRQAVESESVFEHPSPDEFLLAWNWLDGQAAYKKWFDEMSADPTRLAKYVNKVMAIMRKQEGFSGWGGELDSPFFKGLEALDDSLLTEDGRWARDFCIKSMRRNARFHGGERVDDDEAEQREPTGCVIAEEE
jgi:hypothetical protein